MKIEVCAEHTFSRQCNLNFFSVVLIEICWYWLSRVFISTVLIAKIIICSTDDKCVLTQYMF